jgi:hypothetical protein
MIYFFQDLIQDLKSELTSNLENITMAMMMTPAEYDAHQIHDAIEVVFKLCIHVSGKLGKNSVSRNVHVITLSTTRKRKSYLLKLQSTYF